MLERISVEERSSPDLRCSLCHDTEGRLEACPTCGTLFHGACRAHDRQCPTLGCSERLRRIGAPSVRTREPREPALEAFLQDVAGSLLMAFVAYVGVVLTGVVADTTGGVLSGVMRAAQLGILLLHFFFAPARWATLRRGTRSPLRAASIAVGSVSLMLVLAVVLLRTGDRMDSSSVALIAIALVLLGPAVGAWLGAGACDDESAPTAPQP